MSNRGIVLVGGPDSGKTNYLARLWEALRAGHGALTAYEVPRDIEYVEGALAYLLRGKFAPRTDMNLDQSGPSFSIPVVAANKENTEPVEIVVPDVTGELWKEAVDTYEFPSRWMGNLRSSVGALIFLRVSSNQNIDLLDWVTASDVLRTGTIPTEAQQDGIPTAMALCEMLRFLEYALASNTPVEKPHVAILITAWDLLDSTTAAEGPLAFLHAQFPMLAGRIADVSSLIVNVFGTSVVGGDFQDNQFKEDFFEKPLNESGYVVHESNGSIHKEKDITLPVAWVLQGINEL